MGTVFVTAFLGAIMTTYSGYAVASLGPTPARVAHLQSSFQVLYSFGLSAVDGRRPVGGVIADEHDALYGTTSEGGAGLGTLFELEQSGTRYVETHAHVFEGTDGGVPSASLYEHAGEIFATTQGGGAADDGTVGVFVPSAGGFTEIRSFAFDGADGAYPVGSLTAAGDTLYTTTMAGGKYGYGAIVALTLPALQERDVYDFAGGSDGETPLAGLARDASGAFYGTTLYGGYEDGGVVFKFVPIPSGGTESVVWAFNNHVAGGLGSPQGGVALDSSGNIYGTTGVGGTYNDGTVFELTPGSGAYLLTILHSFGYPNDGAYPISLTRKDNHLYGTTYGGGAGCGCGTVFALSTSGSHYAVLHAFTGSDGMGPVAAPSLHGGALYGTASAGGAYHRGTVYRIEL